MDAKLIDLIQRDVDGQLTAAEFETLAEHLRRDAPAREYHADLKKLASGLGRVGSVEPPPELRAALLSLQPAAPPQAGEGILERLRRTWSGARILRYAYAFAAGSVVGIAGYLWVSGTAATLPLDDTDLSGTMAPSGPGAEATLLRRIDFDDGSVGGSALLHRIGTRFSIELALDPRRPLDVEMEFDDGKVKLRGFRGDRAGVGSLRVTDHGLSFVQDRPDRLQVWLDAPEGPPATVALRLRASGETVHESVFSLPASSE